MVPEIIAKIHEVIDLLSAEEPSHEIRQVVTALEEAEKWYWAHNLKRAQK